MGHAIAINGNLDVFIVSDINHYPLGRPWLTAILDKTSERPLGFSLSFQPPSHSSVIEAIRNIRNSNYILTEKVQDNFPPNILFVENGREFYSPKFLKECNSLGITVYYSPFFNTKGDKFFKLLNEVFLEDFFPDRDVWYQNKRQRFSTRKNFVCALTNWFMNRSNFIGFNEM